MSGGPLWQSGQEEPSGRRWIAVAIGALVVAAAVAAVALLSPRSQPRSAAPAETHPYAQQLSISDVEMATAETFLGGTVYYVEGMLHNGGDRTVSGVRIEATFYDTLGQVVQREPLRALAIVQRVDHVDAIDMSIATIAPGQVGQFRLTLDHISAEWNGQYPELRVVDVTLQ